MSRDTSKLSPNWCKRVLYTFGKSDVSALTNDPVIYCLCILELPAFMGDFMNALICTVHVEYHVSCT